MQKVYYKKLLLSFVAYLGMGGYLCYDVMWTYDYQRQPIM